MHKLRTLSASAAIAIAASGANAFDLYADLYGSGADYDYNNEDFEGYGLDVAAQFDGRFLWIEQLSLRKIYLENQDDDGVDIKNEQISVHFGLPFESIDAAVFLGYLADNGYDGDSEDEYYFGGIDSVVFRGERLKLSTRLGVTQHVEGVYPSEGSSEVGFFHLFADLQVTDKIDLSGSVGGFRSFGDFGDSTGESLSTNIANIRASYGFSQKIAAFAEYNFQTGGWEDEPDDFETQTVSLGISISLGANAASDGAKWKPISFTPISWVRLDGW
ncbi:MAG: hypothetical protein AAF198_02865 [Pseudomonadota bacterium]